MRSKRLKDFLKRPWNPDRHPSPLIEPDPARQTYHSTSRPLDSADSITHASATTSVISSDDTVATAVPAQPSTAIVTAHGGTVADRPDTLVVPGEAPEPQNPTTPILQALAPPTTTTEPSSTSALTSEHSVPSLQERLLVEAYDALKFGEPKVVDAYEKLLSVKVKDTDSEPTDEAENRIAAFTQEEWGRMKQMIEDGLKKRQRSAAVYKKINDAIQFATPIKPIITQVVQASPLVATAWVGVSLALEILINPLEESESSISGIAYVVSRMEWYWALVGLLSSTTSNAHLALQRKIEDQFSKLYQKLLLYQMKSICRYFRARFKTFCRDLGKLDDWDGQLEAIKTSEVVLLRDFRTYNDQVLVGDTHEMVGFLKTIDSSAEDIRKGLHYVTSAMECYLKLKEDAQKDEKHEKCRRDLFLTDPEADKQRIIDSKGDLLEASYEWILDLPEFQRWKTNPESRRLWIRGDPGKGKTMLLCGIIEELERNRLERLCYFFCQATMPKLNNATSVLRGLVYQLVKKYPWLIDSVLAEYNDTGKQCFEDHNAWQTMSKILLNILRDPCMNGVLLIVDALDECIDFKDRRRLLVFIDRASSKYNAKWIISSRNWQDIEETLDTNTNIKHTLSLEMNKHLISDAVKVYIKARVMELAEVKKLDTQTHEQVERHLIKNSNDTFLWVALVCEALRDVATYEIPLALETFPAGLAEMYERMMPNDTTTDAEKLRAKVLATISVVKRPIPSEELSNIVELPSHISGNTKSVEQLVKSCGSFLNLQDGTIYFIHQSAADFLREKEFQEFPDLVSRHFAIFRHSLRALAESKVMKCNIYNIEAPGTSIEDVVPPQPNLLTSLAYSCLYWVEHLCDSAYVVESRDGREDYVSGILAFLQKRFLYWVEAFILLGHVSKGIKAIQKLATLIVS
ncbi:Vegetative incompatibility protein HET-E-1 [Colletotrichum tropicale]|nr:Vegetative incompatibility protein HET-E-1 [Colletotrichum tropicale]